jgi:hypothetical protein
MYPRKRNHLRLRVFEPVIIQRPTDSVNFHVNLLLRFIPQSKFFLKFSNAPSLLCNQLFVGLCRFVWKRRRRMGIEGTTMSRADEVRAKPNP